MPVQSTLRRSFSTPELSRKFCWLCKKTEKDFPFAKWVQPCRCWSNRSIHEQCGTVYYILSKKYYPSIEPRCPWCKTDYATTTPSPPNLVTKIMDNMESHLPFLCDVGAMGIISFCCAFSSFIYGRFLLFLVFGPVYFTWLVPENGYQILFCGALFPVALEKAYAFGLDDVVVHQIIKVYRYFRPLPSSSGIEIPPLTVPEQPSPELWSLDWWKQYSRGHFGTVLPLMATNVGKLFVKEWNWKRFMLGALTILTAKQVFYGYKQYLYKGRQSSRIVGNFEDHPQLDQE